MVLFDTKKRELAHFNIFMTILIKVLNQLLLQFNTYLRINILNTFSTLFIISFVIFVVN